MKAGLRFWLFLASLALFGRLFQTRVLWAEETLPLAVAQQMLAGAGLYRDVWFDKPPLLAWFYAGVLGLVGASGYGLRMVGVFYILAVTFVGYLLADRLWGQAAGRWTAFFLAFFTAFYIPSATVALAADLLLLLPHLAAFYFLVSGRAALAGLSAGLAFHLNAKALFVAAAAGAWLFLAGRRGEIFPLAAGFLLPAAAGAGLLALTGGWSGYLEQVWRWGSLYAQAPFSESPWELGLTRSLNYLGFHAALALGAVMFFRRPSMERTPLALWLGICFLGVLAGARFFPRYYFQILPPLAVAAGAGWAHLPRRGMAVAALGVALTVPAVRFGRVNLWLALGIPFSWSDAAMDADSRRVAARVRELTHPAERIFVWGFRPEVYYYAGRIGASRFLESQPLTGVLADRHLARSDPFTTAWAARNRRLLAEELAASRPAMIVDGLGSYNPRLAIENYAEIQPLLRGYRLVDQTAGARVYGRSREGD